MLLDLASHHADLGDGLRSLAVVAAAERAAAIGEQVAVAGAQT